MRTSGDPVRLFSMARRDSLLGRGLDAARASGPSDDQLKALENGVLAGLGMAGALAATADRLGKTQAGALSTRWLSDVAGNLVVVLAAAVTVGGAALLAWHLTGRSYGHQASISGYSAAAPEGSLSRAPEQPLIPLGTDEQPQPVALPTSPGTQPVAQALAQTTENGPAKATFRAAASRQGHLSADQELSLLKQASRELASSPAQALVLAEQHRRRFPASVMQEERELIAITALARLGRTAEARKRADKFSQAHVGSVYQGQIEDALARPQ